MQWELLRVYVHVCHCVCMRETAQEKSVTSDVILQSLPVMMESGLVCVFCMCHFQTTRDEAAVCVSLCVCFACATFRPHKMRQQCCGWRRSSPQWTTPTAMPRRVLDVSISSQFALNCPRVYHQGIDHHLKAVWVWHQIWAACFSW